MEELHGAKSREEAQSFHALSRSATFPHLHESINPEALQTPSSSVFMEALVMMVKSLAMSNRLNFQPLSPPPTGVGWDAESSSGHVIGTLYPCNQPPPLVYLRAF